LHGFVMDGVYLTAFAVSIAIMSVFSTIFKQKKK
jgi:hypothetical protein